VSKPALGRSAAAPPHTDTALNVAHLYDAHFDFVWRSLRRLGVPDSALDDAAQDVFVVVQRRVADFEGRSTLKTWLFGIVLRVASAHRKQRARSGREVAEDDTPLVGTHPDPQQAAIETEAARAVQALIDPMPEERRVVFVMMDLEDFTADEVAQSLGVGINTVYSRLRLARRDFEAGLKRMRAREQRRSP
jgi:RNA polymerase sigma-70 factor (ECF subfamily)